MAVKKVIPIKPVTAWSFSRYTDYCSCPLKFKYKYVDKMKEPSNDAMNRGAAIHELAEQYVKGIYTKRTFPVELAAFKTLFMELRKQYKKKINGMVVEDSWAFRDDWSETSWNDWAGCWLRIKLDAAWHRDEVTLEINDWKTGKFKPDQNVVYMEQLELYALAALILHPHLERAIPRLRYLDQDVVFPADGEEVVYTPADIPKLKKTWEKRVRAMMSDTKFVATPNNKCRWCFFGQSGKAKGGPGLCKY